MTCIIRRVSLSVCTHVYNVTDEAAAADVGTMCGDTRSIGRFVEQASTGKTMRHHTLHGLSTHH